MQPPYSLLFLLLFSLGGLSNFYLPLSDSPSLYSFISYSYSGFQLLAMSFKPRISGSFKTILTSLL